MAWLPGLRHRLTKVVHDVALAPLAPKPVLLLRRTAHAGAQKQVIKLVAAEFAKGLRGERFDLLEVGAVELQDGDGVAGAVVVERLVRALGARDVPRADNDFVGLGLGEELADDLEALGSVLAWVW